MPGTEQPQAQQAAAAGLEGLSQAVQDVIKCSEAIQRRRRRQKQREAAEGRGDERRRSRAALDANRALREQYLAVLQRRDGASRHASHAARVKALQRMVVMQGLPTDTHEPLVTGGRRSSLGGGGGSPPADEERCSLRGMVWKVLLGAYHVDAMLYVRLVEQGASWKDYLIRQDTFRTFKGDEAFRRRVPEEKLSRVNNAFVRLNFPEHDPTVHPPPPVSSANSSATAAAAAAAAGTPPTAAPTAASSPIASPPHSPRPPQQTTPRSSGMAHFGEERGGGSGGGYVQGMTILCAPFLFVMPEVDAFFCFNALLTRHLPRYVTPNLDGVHAGCALIGRVLQVVDPQLHAHLSGRAGDIKIFAFPLLMSLHACMPPLEETLKIWDVLFAFGVHMEVLLAAAQCLLVRARLLADPNPYNLLNFRYLPPLDSEVLVSAAFCLIPHLPQALLDEVARHPLAPPSESSPLPPPHPPNPAGAGSHSAGGEGGGAGGGGVASGPSPRRLGHHQHSGFF